MCSEVQISHLQISPHFPAHSVPCGLVFTHCLLLHQPLLFQHYSLYKGQREAQILPAQSVIFHTSMAAHLLHPACFISKNARNCLQGHSYIYEMIGCSSEGWACLQVLACGSHKYLYSWQYLNDACSCKLLLYCTYNFHLPRNTIIVAS